MRAFVLTGPGQFTVAEVEPPVAEPGQVVVDPDAPFYDLQAKYLASRTTMRIPAPVPDEIVYLNFALL